jgi:hypothetical protein
MQGMKQLAAVAVAGLLALGAGVAFAAETKAPETGKIPEAAKPAETGKSTQGATPAPMAPAKQAKQGKELGADHFVRGEVTAVDSAVTPPTVTLKVWRGKTTETLTLAVPSTAKILEGKSTKAIADLKVGERVRVKYDQMSNRLEADQIHILKAAKAKAS